MSEIKKYNVDKYTWQVVYNDGTDLWECSQGSPPPKACGSQGSPTPRSGANGDTNICLCLSVGLVNTSTDHKPASGGIDEYKGQNIVPGQGHPIIAKYDQIDRNKITKFNVYETKKLGTDDLKPVISLDIKPGYRLIWRKRRHQRVIGPQVPFMTVYLVGWQATIPFNKGGQGGCEGQNVQSIIYLYEDGKMEMSSQKSDYELFNFETETP